MTREKAQHLIALLGDRKESVLSLLSEQQADFLRQNPVKAEAVNPLEIEDLVQAILESETPDTSETSESLANEPLTLDAEEEALFGDGELEPTIEGSEEEEALFSENDTDLDEASGFDDMGLDGLDDASVSSGDDYKSVADMLEQQTPQLVTFFLNKLAEDKRTSLLAHLPEQYQADLQTLNVEDIPISDDVFEDLYNELFKGWN